MHLFGYPLSTFLLLAHLSRTLEVRELQLALSHGQGVLAESAEFEFLERSGAGQVKWLILLQ